MDPSFRRQVHPGRYRASDCDPGPRSRLSISFVAVMLGLMSGGAAAPRAVEQRAGVIDCGRTQIRALAECYEKTGYCATETLSFARRAGRTIVPVHAGSAMYELSGLKTRALDYRAVSWACLSGKTGGHYLVVVMNRAGGGSCADCEYSRLYDLNGRLIATDRDKGGRDMMHEVLGGPGRHVFSSVYP